MPVGKFAGRPRVVPIKKMSDAKGQDVLVRSVVGK
jgi:hypothetical protein